MTSESNSCSGLAPRSGSRARSRTRPRLRRNTPRPPRPGPSCFDASANLADQWKPTISRSTVRLRPRSRPPGRVLSGPCARAASPCAPRGTGQGGCSGEPGVPTSPSRSSGTPTTRPAATATTSRSHSGSNRPRMPPSSRTPARSCSRRCGARSAVDCLPVGDVRDQTVGPVDLPGTESTFQNSSVHTCGRSCGTLTHGLDQALGRQRDGGSESCDGGCRRGSE